jgi:cysteine desulfurase
VADLTNGSTSGADPTLETARQAGSVAGAHWSPAGYLDAASGMPLHPAARAALTAAYQDGWADPARLNQASRRSRMLLDAARESTAASLGARPDEISFTSSGTTAIHLGIAGLLVGRRRVGGRLLVSAVEHSAVLQAGRHHERSGGELTEIPVAVSGAVDVQSYAAALRQPGVAAAALQSANHEVGTLQPLELVGALTAELGVPLLVDASASVGRLPVPPVWSVLTASAHKWGGPAGVGILAVRTGVRWRSPSPDDPREGGRVPGFPDVPAIAAAAAALEAVASDLAADGARLSALIDRIRDQVPRLIPDVQVVGDPVDRLPHIVTFSCLYVDGETILSALDRAGFAVSSGSACVSDSLVPSHVLAAMGVLTHGNVRVSLPPDVREQDIDRFLAVLPGLVADVRAQLGASDL